MRSVIAAWFCLLFGSEALAPSTRRLSTAIHRGALPATWASSAQWASRPEADAEVDERSDPAELEYDATVLDIELVSHKRGGLHCWLKFQLMVDGLRADNPIVVRETADGVRAILTLPPDEAATALAAATAEAVERGLPPPKSPLSAGALDFAIVDEDGAPVAADAAGPAWLRVTRLDPTRAQPYADEPLLIRTLLDAMMELHDDERIPVERRLFVCTARGKASLVRGLLERRQELVRARPAPRPAAAAAPPLPVLVANAATAGAVVLFTGGLASIGGRIGGALEQGFLSGS